MAEPSLLIDYFYKWEKQRAQQVYLKQPFGDEFVDFTWYEVGQQARKLATYLRSLGLPEVTNVGLVSKNCAQWVIADLAITMAGMVSVPFYPTLTAEQINQVLVHSGCAVCFVGKLDDWAGMKAGIPASIHCIAFPTYNPDPGHAQWDDILSKYEAQSINYVPKGTDLFSIVYTSGTTGNPKGVMLSQNALASIIHKLQHILMTDLPETRFFSYLPLCHIAERNIVEAVSLLAGGTVYFAESLDSFAKNLAAASPTHFMAVPRIWTKFQLGILNKMSQKKLDILLNIPILSGIIKKKIRKGLGLNDAQLVLTGAAPMPASLIRWFRRLGINIQEAYGMTENVGAVCMMPRHQMKDGTVGQIYPGVEIKLAGGTGEILMRSAWVMDGYYKEPTMTAETMKEGWLCTGDVGELDSGNFLKITGRVKEMYKTSKGEYVAPAQIEFGFADNKLIEQICVVGQNLPQPIALVVLSDIGLSASQEAVNQSLADTLNALNPRLKNYERVRKLVVMKKPWTVDNNMLTPTLKTKRNVIEKNYNDMLEGWYDQAQTVVWEI